LWQLWLLAIANFLSYAAQFRYFEVVIRELLTLPYPTHHAGKSRIFGMAPGHQISLRRI
jgi:hypothetical protein